jgi:site-specific DNA recombinase
LTDPGSRTRPRPEIRVRASPSKRSADGPAFGLVTVWSELFPAEQARIVHLLVERVDVREDALEVRIRAEGLASLVGELRQQGERMAAC